jgi:hypothetical protein
LDRSKQHADRVLAVVAGDGDELIQDGRAVAVPGGSIARRDLDQQFAFGAETHR